MARAALLCGALVCQRHGENREQTMATGLLGGCIAAAALTLAMGLGTAKRTGSAEEVTLNVWSHEADEDAKVAFRELAAKNLEKAHPGAHVKITWYEKNPLLAALKTALPAGPGPDVLYVGAGWAGNVEACYLAPPDGLVGWGKNNGSAANALSRYSKT